ncbi:MAG: hypothetical protein JJT88_12550 [Gammaproteobacteria bacterium]|nr:hypothetical protein [Gammaproteobacteria bacterium]
MKSRQSGGGYAELTFLVVCLIAALTAVTLMWIHREDFEFLLAALRAEWAALSAEMEATLEELRDVLAGSQATEQESD